MDVITLRFEIGGNSFFVPCYENTSLQITKRVSSLDNLSSQATITKETFRVPLTTNLINAIGDVADLSQEASINLNKKINGQIYINSLPRFKGSFQYIKSFRDFQSGVKEVEFLFNGNEISIKQELEDVTLASLLDGETIPYNKAELDTFFADPELYKTTNGYYFPLIDYGQRFTADDASTVGTIIGAGETALTQLDFKPSVTFKKILDLTPLDITWDSSVDDLIEDQSILLHNNDSRESLLDSSPRDYTGYLGRSSSLVEPLVAGVQKRIVFNEEYNYNQDSIDLGNNQYDVTVSGLHTFRITGSVNLANGTATDRRVRFAFLRDPSFSTPIIVQNINVDIPASSSVEFDIDITFTLNVTASETIGLKMMFYNVIGTNTNMVTILRSGFKFQIIQTPALTINSNIDIPANCPDISAWQILRHILLQCNGILELSSDGIYNIVPWVNWIDSNSTIVNIDDKIDPSKQIESSPYSIRGAKSISLSYSKGGDLLSNEFENNQGMNYGELKIRDTGTDGTSKKLSFKTDLTSIPLSYIDNSSAVIHKLFDKDFKTIKDSFVIIQTYKDGLDQAYNMGLSFDLADALGIGSTTNYIKYPYTGHWQATDNGLGGYNSNDYNFGQSLTYFRSEGYPNNNLYERFWKQYINETYSEQSREVTLSVRLPIEIVDTLELNEKVYFEGSLFRIVELNNVPLNSDEPFNIKLMKRVTIENIDIAPFYPYNVINGIVRWKDSSDNSDLGDASSEPAAEVEQSSLAYGFAYDSNQNIANQRGQILSI